MEDVSYFEDTCNKIMKTREWVVGALRELQFKVLDSAANFVFASPSRIEAEKLFLELKQKGLLVRYFNKPRINQYLRISIGTDDEMKAFIEGVQHILEKENEI